jgi:hypothetical protein
LSAFSNAIRPLIAVITINKALIELLTEKGLLRKFWTGSNGSKQKLRSSAGRNEAWGSWLGSFKNLPSARPQCTHTRFPLELECRNTDSGGVRATRFVDCAGRLEGAVPHQPGSRL